MHKRLPRRTLSLMSANSARSSLISAFVTRLLSELPTSEI